MTQLKNGGDSKVIIGEATPVRIGLVIAFLGVFATGIYWASSINSKLDSILSFQNSAQTTFSELKSKNVDFEKDLSDMKLKMALSDVAVKSLQDRVTENQSKAPSK